MLLKFALILGVEFIENITFEEICPRNLIPLNISGNSKQVNVEVVRCCSSAQSARNGSKSSVVAGSSSDVVVTREEGATSPGCQLKRKLCASSSANDDPLPVSGSEQKIFDTNPSHQDDDGDPIVARRKERSEVDGNVCFSEGKKSENSLPRSHRQEDRRFPDREHEGDGEEENDRVNALRSPSSHEHFDRTNRKKPSGIKSNHEASDESSDDTSSSSENDIKETKAGSLFKTTADEEGIKLREESDQTRDGAPKRNGNEESTCFCCCHLHLDEGKKSSPWKTSDDYVGALAHFAINSKNPATASPYVDYEKILSKLHTFQFDIVLGADGRRNTLSDNFPRKEFRGRLAIAITANFVNTHTLTEAQIPEISGISFIYNQQLFRCVTLW